MPELVLATYATEMKGIWAKEISDPDLINLLYDAVSLPVGLTNKKGNPIEVSKGTASKIMSRTIGGNVNRAIREHAFDFRVLQSIEDYFENYVLTELMEGAEPQLVHRLSSIIKSDTLIPDKEKEELLSLGSDGQLAAFLSKSYLHTLLRDNVLRLKKGTVSQTEDEMEEIKKHPLPADNPSSKIKRTEKRYIDALMDVYGQLTKIDRFKLANLDSFPEHKTHFARQREDYLLAEAVRRGTRDIYGDTDEENFNVFLDEVCSGVIDIWEEPHLTGFDRLKDVLVAAVRTPVQQCWISRETAWIGNHQKKGACHVLVNEGKLEGWVR